MIGYEAGRRAQFAGFDDVLERARSAARGRSCPGDVVLAGIGASNAALAAPLQELRSAGLTAWRTDCADIPAPPRDAPGLVIAVSQSGRSVETVALIDQLGRAGAPTLAITNADENPLADVAAESLTLGGRADSRVSTVGFVTTFTALAVFAETLVGAPAPVPWEDLPAVAEAAVAAAAPALRDFAAEHLASGSVDVIGAVDRMTPVEAVALLLREGPQVPAAAYGTRGYLHGPMDVAGADVAHIVLGGARERTLVAQLRERTSSTFHLAEPGSRDLGSAGADIPAALTIGQRSLIEVCVLQELVSAVSAVRGVAVDDSVFVRQDTKLT